MTPQQLTVAETRAQLRRAVIRNYSVEGRDGEKRSVVSRLYDTFDALEEEGPEQEEDPRSVVNRRGLCLAGVHAPAFLDAGPAAGQGGG